MSRVVFVQLSSALLCAASISLSCGALADTQKWSHNNSTMALKITGNSLEVRYTAPRAGLSSMVSSGDLLLDGTFSDGEFVGLARVFKAGCSPAVYAVEGTFSPTDTSFVVNGEAPVFERSGCNVARYEKESINSSLLFTRDGSSGAPDLNSSGGSSTGQSKQSVSADTGEYRIQFCNKSNVEVWTALAVREGSNMDTVIRAWWRLPVGECRYVYNGSFGKYSSVPLGYYAYGRNGSNLGRWPTNAESYADLCVANTKYHRRSYNGYTCSDGEELKKFGFLTLRRPDRGLENATINLVGHLDYGSPPVARAPSYTGPKAADVITGLAAGMVIGGALIGRGGGVGGYNQQIPTRKAPRQSGISQ